VAVSLASGLLRLWLAMTLIFLPSERHRARLEGCFFIGRFFTSFRMTAKSIACHSERSEDAKTDPAGLVRSAPIPYAMIDFPEAVQPRSLGRRADEIMKRI
jgi:hypothetical protein